MLTGDFVWLLRCIFGLRRAGFGWQIAVGAFTAAQIAGLVLIVFFRTRNHGLQFLFTTPVLACIYLWHFLFIIPLMITWLPLLIAKLSVRLARILAGLKRSEEHTSELQSQ